MIFEEKKTKEGYKYTVEDLFGKMVINSPERLVYKDESQNLNSSKLDDAFYAIYKHHSKDFSKKIEGKIKNTEITYIYIKAKIGWDKIFNEEIKSFVEKIFDVPFENITEKSKHLFAAWYSEEGHKLNKRFKNKLINYKKEICQKKN